MTPIIYHMPGGYLYGVRTFGPQGIFSVNMSGKSVFYDWMCDGVVRVEFINFEKRENDEK